MYHHKPSDDWDKKERRMDEADMKAADDEPDKEKVDVVTEEHEHDVPMSGLFCIYDDEFAFYMFEGDSLCRDCWVKKRAEVLEEFRKKKNNGTT